METKNGRWRGLLVPLDRVSGDGRVLATPPGGHLRVRPLPLPLMYQDSTDVGHKGAVLVGLTDRVWLADGAVWGEGAFNLSDPRAAAVYDKLAGGWHRWVSVTPDDYIKQYRVVDPAGAFTTLPVEAAQELGDGFRTVEVLPDWRLMGVTLVNEQSFPEAAITIAPTPVAAAAAAELDAGVEDDCAFVASSPATFAVTGDTSLPIASRDRAWDGSAAKARIFAWASGGDGGVDPAKVAKAFLYRDEDADPTTKAAYKLPFADVIDGQLRIVPRAVFAVASVLQGGRGGVAIPEGQAAKVKQKVSGLYERMGERAPWEAETAAAEPVEEPVAITAAVSGLVQLTDPETGEAWQPPADWFAPPELPGYTRLTVTEDGRVFGHVGHWAAEHLSRPGVRPPASSSGYAYFLRRAVRCGDGSVVRVGTITVGAGHAGLSESAVAAMAHYDNTATQAAIVTAGEDTHGIWIAGAVLPGLEAEARNQLSLADLSGDWRVIGGGLEMVGAHGVNTPGFLTLEPETVDVAQGALAACVLDGPVLRAGDGGTPYALVAAGMVPRPRTSPEDEPDAFTVEAARQVDAAMERMRQAFTTVGEQLAAALQPTFANMNAVTDAMRAQQTKAARSRAGQAIPVRTSAARAQRRAAAAQRMTALRARQQARRVAAVRARARRQRAMTASARIEEAAVMALVVEVLAEPEAFNWVEDAGGLPSFVKRIAKHLRAKGFSESHAIATAINAVKKMCASGDTNWPGAQQVNAKSRAQACAALARWERMKAAA